MQVGTPVTSTPSTATSASTAVRGTLRSCPAGPRSSATSRPSTSAMVFSETCSTYAHDLRDRRRLDPAQLGRALRPPTPRARSPTTVMPSAASRSANRTAASTAGRGNGRVRLAGVGLGDLDGERRDRGDVPVRHVGRHPVRVDAGTGEQRVVDPDADLVAPCSRSAGRPVPPGPPSPACPTTASGSPAPGGQHHVPAADQHELAAARPARTVVGSVRSGPSAVSAAIAVSSLAVEAGARGGVAADVREHVPGEHVARPPPRSTLPIRESADQRLRPGLRRCAASGTGACGSSPRQHRLDRRHRDGAGRRRERLRREGRRFEGEHAGHEVERVEGEPPGRPRPSTATRSPRPPPARTPPGRSPSRRPSSRRPVAARTATGAPH